ncbi:MAG TPA: pyridoxamine 5'-phosphate oxidase [Methylophaga aminisulfidivorans]|uniref:Pyridoxine/pyridoxamine 5'-phosphate oxidase n=1 Tax=Methylophaga aminisulfidivorans TaxID=230105 RepID=A0A7C1VQF0_9GAMM|nr:pyridoxamine 5'-phosphate oxidase [Methylophaga aminisulfidivorans]
MSDNHELSKLRTSYEKGVLEENEAADIPLNQFQEWFEVALNKNINEPNAMTVATADENGRPSCRPVLIKAYDERGIVWFTNYHSRKGRQLSANPFASLQFFWPELERVVRIEGKVERVSAQESNEYFDSRPLASRIGAWASEQSQTIESRKIIVERAARFGLQFGLHPPRPEHWGGYRLVPDYWEFWQGRKSRLHDRVCFSMGADGKWIKERLAP